MFFIMIKKTMDKHVSWNLTFTIIVFVSFDFWMSHGGVDVFYLIINIFEFSRVPTHVIVGLFEMNKTTRWFIDVQLQSLLEKFGLLHWVIVFLKDEGINMTTMKTTLHSIIDCEPNFQGLQRCIFWACDV
jgi:hypothetical protein